MTAGPWSCPGLGGERFTMLAAALRAGAAGLYCAEAGAGLLIGQKSWLGRSDFTGSFIIVTAGLAGPARVAVVGWNAAVAALDGGALPCGSGSGGCCTWRRASLAGYQPIWARRSPGWTVPVSQPRPGPSCTPAGTGAARSPCRRTSRLTWRRRCER